MIGYTVVAFSVRRVLVCALVIWAGVGLVDPLHAQTSGSKKTATKAAKAGSSKTTRATPSKAAKPAAKPGKKVTGTKSGSGKAEIQAKRSELKDIERQLGNLQRDLEKTQTQQTEAVRAVAEAEREVSKATRTLRQVMAERTEVNRQLNELEAGQRSLEERIVARQNELGEWLRRNYMHGATSDIAALLAARDPNQFVRDTYYLERLGRARLELIEGLRADLQLKNERAQQVTSRRETLTRLEDDRRKRQEKLEETHSHRRETLGKIETTLKTQRERMNALKADEERLTQVVTKLVQQAADAEKRAAAARRERERANARSRPRQDGVADRGAERFSDTKKAVEPVVGRVREVPEPTPGGTSFAQLRGKLNFPVAGELLGRFGAPRAGQGTTWRGVFIRAARGAEVRAVSGGSVVYSDWLRGYGNLLIVDHGGGYLSIYGNNDALYKEAGSSVRTGEAIASVGASGSESESGLYFEIRHRGQAVDPMQWVRLR
ncbi:MAG: peptidoglycan DD-metalloendopeptidase family protein [Azoarcus sp.]|nr:peptidoglycan DD-metalloendopeptidase family protein [Azoarcus sp.]